MCLCVSAVLCNGIISISKGSINSHKLWQVHFDCYFSEAKNGKHTHIHTKPLQWRVQMENVCAPFNSTNERQLQNTQTHTSGKMNVQICGGKTLKTFTIPRLSDCTLIILLILCIVCFVEMAFCFHFKSQKKRRKLSLSHT